MNAEQWRPVADFHGLYEVSDMGRVRSLPRRTTSGKILRSTPTSKGYLTVALCDGPRRETRSVHRLVAVAFLGERPAGQHVRHLDGNPANNALVNLAYGTPSENELDKLRHGRNKQALKTECPRGHSLTDESNIKRNSRGTRQCRTCEADWQRRRYLEMATCDACGTSITAPSLPRHKRESCRAQVAS